MLKESGLEVNAGLIRGKLEDLITFVSTAAEKEQPLMKSSGGCSEVCWNSAKCCSGITLRALAKVTSENR